MYKKTDEIVNSLIPGLLTVDVGDAVIITWKYDRNLNESCKFCECQTNHSPDIT